jgi:hypothetical protein
MKAKHIGDNIVNFDDGTAWPLPENDEGDRYHDRVAWRLRYGQPSKSDLLVAADVMAAYEALIYQTQKRRNEIASAIRAATKMRDARTKEHA